MGGVELFLILEHPGGSVPRRAGASCRAGAIRCDPELARGWSGLSPRPGNRHFGGAPSPCQRPFIFWVASEHANNVIEMRFRGRKVPEGPHLVAPDSRHWRAVGRTALRAMGNISVMLPLACFNAIALKNKLFFDPGLCPRMALCQSCANQPLFRLLFLPWLCRPFDPPTTKLPWDAAGDLSAI